jgi:hypothetical protein
MTKRNNDEELTLTVTYTVTYFDKVTRGFIDYYSQRDPKKRDAMDQPDYVTYEALSAAGRPFICSIEGNAIKAEQYVFMVYFLPDDKRLQVQALIGSKHSPIISESAPKEFRNKEAFADKWYRYADDFQPIAAVFSDYKLATDDLKQFKQLSWPVDPKVNEVFGNLFKKILEPAGYIVIIDIPDYYFPAPTGASLVAPVFAMGLQKDVKPIDSQDGYETVFTYLSIEKPQSKTQIQLKLINTPEERLYEFQRAFRNNLTPYGLKSLYLVIEECGHNKRNPWFVLDSNRCLDLLGHTRTNKGVHQTKNRKRLLSELEALTKINFNIERRQPGRAKNKDKVIKFKAPLLSITGQFEEWEVESGKPTEEGTQIKDNIQIFLHPQIYADIGDWYTYIPHDFLKIDARSNPHAILLYPYIANQWRIGWSQYRGSIKQSIRRLLEGSGLLDRLPKRANQQRDFIENIKNSLTWLRDQKEFWIKSVKFQRKPVPLLDQTVNILMADDHPLKVNMTKQITAD